MSIRVLVIDDSAVMRRLVMMTLNDAGYAAYSASDGEEGMRLWQQTEPELVITDIMMPERDGIETIMEIRRHRPRAKILAMTGFRHSGSVDFAEMLQRLGADDVLVKPFDPEVLLTRVDRLISREPVELTAA